MNMNKSITKFGILPVAILSLSVLAAIGVPTNEDQQSFTYIGELSQKGIPYSGSADVTFTLWDARRGGSTVAATTRMQNITIKDGMFKVPISFNDSAFSNNATRWLEVTVRAPSGKGSFTTLTPRREVSRAGSLSSSNNNDRLYNGFENIQLMAPDFYFSAPNSIYLNIDSDNNSNTAVLEIAKHRTRDTGGVSLFKVQEDGKVGIGTTTPGSRLAIKAADGSSAGALRIISSMNSSDIIHLQDASPGDQGLIAILAGGLSKIVLRANGNTYFDGGNVGIGTSMPGSRLAIKAADGSSAGGLRIISSINSNDIIQIQDASPGDQGLIAIRAGGSNKIVQRANGNTYFNGGYVGIGTALPRYQLEVVDNRLNTHIARFTNISTTTVADGIGIQIGPNVNPGNNNAFVSFYDGDGTFLAAIVGDGVGGVYYATSSDARLKTNIAAFGGGLDMVSRMKVRKYEFIEAPGKERIGFIAQELQTVFPQAVSGDPEGDVEERPMGVDYGRVTPVLVSAIQELNAKVQQKDLQITELQARLTALEAMVEQLVLQSQESAK